jgi:hypothetical protein
MGVVVSTTPRPLYPREWPGTHCTGDWVGRSGRVRKISPPPGFNPRTVQPVASRYNDWAIAAHNKYTKISFIFFCFITFNLVFGLYCSFSSRRDPGFRISWDKPVEIPLSHIDDQKFLRACWYKRSHIGKICIWKWWISTELQAFAPWIKLLLMLLHKVNTSVCVCVSWNVNWRSINLLALLISEVLQKNLILCYS